MYFYKNTPDNSSVNGYLAQTGYANAWFRSSCVTLRSFYTFDLWQHRILQFLLYIDMRIIKLLPDFFLIEIFCVVFGNL